MEQPKILVIGQAGAGKLSLIIGLINSCREGPNTVLKSSDLHRKKNERIFTVNNKKLVKISIESVDQFKADFRNEFDEFKNFDDLDQIVLVINPCDRFERKDLAEVYVYLKSLGTRPRIWVVYTHVDSVGLQACINMQDVFIRLVSQSMHGLTDESKLPSRDFYRVKTTADEPPYGVEELAKKLDLKQSEETLCCCGCGFIWQLFLSICSSVFSFFCCFFPVI